MTLMSTDPGKEVGLIAVMVPSEFDTNELAGTLPNMTDVAPSRCVPMIFTDIPPEIEPSVTSRPVMFGGGVT